VTNYSCQWFFHSIIFFSLCNYVSLICPFLFTLSQQVCREGYVLEDNSERKMFEKDQSTVVCWLTKIACHGVYRCFSLFSTWKTWGTPITPNLCLINNHIQSASSPVLTSRLTVVPLLWKLLTAFFWLCPLTTQLNQIWNIQSWGKACNEKPLCSAGFTVHAFYSPINIRNEKRKSEGLETLNFATFQSVIIVYK